MPGQGRGQGGGQEGVDDGHAGGERVVGERRKAPLVALHVWNTGSERAYEGPGDPLTVVVADADRIREAEQHLLDETGASWQKVHPEVVVERRLQSATGSGTGSHSATYVVRPSG